MKDLDVDTLDVKCHVATDERTAFNNVFDGIEDAGPSQFLHASKTGFNLVQNFAGGHQSLVHFSGKGINYFHGVPVGGTIKAISIFKDGDLQQEFSHFKATVSEAYLLFALSQRKIITKLLSGNNKIIGSDGDDYLSGHGHKDNIFGNGGSDSLFGSGGPDKLHGGLGINSLFGNGGKDIFYLDAPLVPGNNTFIGDFQHNKDKIYIESLIFPGLDTSHNHLTGKSFTIAENLGDPNPHVWYDHSAGQFWFVSGGVSNPFLDVPANTPVTQVDIIVG